MIPHPNMLWLAGLGLVPLAIVGVLVPALSPLVIVLVFLLFAIAFMDGVLSRDMAKNFIVTSPSLTRMTRNRVESLPLTVQRKQGRPWFFRLALSRSPEINPTELFLSGWAYSDKRLQLPLQCQPLNRGQVILEFAHLECPSRLKFWMIRHTHPLHAEVRIFPNLQDQRKQASGLFVRRDQVGAANIRKMGKGREFEMLREYVQGDSYEDIHWRSTAKRRMPVTKVFQIERTQEVYVLIDTSRLSARSMQDEDSEPPEPILERYIQSAMLLQQVAAQQGDLFGLVVFNDKVDRFVRARSGKAHYTACAETLYNLKSRMTSPDFEGVFSFIRTRLRKRALLIFLTDLEDPATSETFVKNVQMISRQHLVFVNVISDPAIQPIFGPLPAATSHDLYHHFARHLQWKNNRELHLDLNRKGVQFSEVTNSQASIHVINQYMQVKRRQLL